MKVELNQNFFMATFHRMCLLRNLDVSCGITTGSLAFMSGGNAKRDSVNSKLKSDKFFLRLHCLECVSEETKSVLAGM